MNNLFQLSARYQQLMDRINEVDEISDDLMHELESVNDSLDEKVLNYTAIIKSMESKADAINHAIEGMVKRAKSLVKGAEKLRDRIKNEMKLCDKKKIENEFHRVQIIANNPRVDYSDKTLIPDAYMRKKIHEIIEPNTQLISKALKENIEVPGAYLVQDVRLDIR